RLVTRKIATSETRFIPDPLSPFWQPLAMEESDGKRTLVVWDGTTPVALVRDGKTEFFLSDHLGSVRAIANSKGEIISHYSYDPFGDPEGVATSPVLSSGF